MVLICGEVYKNEVIICFLERTDGIWKGEGLNISVKSYEPTFVRLNVIKSHQKYTFTSDTGRKRKCSVSREIKTGWVVACNNRHTIKTCTIWPKIWKRPADVVFHLGDQIYADRIYWRWQECLQFKSEKTWHKCKDKIQKEYVREYIETWEPLAGILSHTSNIMIPDDHEMRDRAYVWEKPEKDEPHTKRLKHFLYQTALEVAGRLYLGLRLTNKTKFDYCRNIGNTSIVMHERVSHPFMCDEFQNSVKASLPHLKDNVFWLGALPPFKTYSHFVERFLYGHEENIPFKLYDDLYELFHSDKKRNVIFIGGDLHAGTYGNIKKKDSEELIGKYHVTGPSSGFCPIYLTKDALSDTRDYYLEIESFRPSDVNAVWIDLENFKSQHVFKQYWIAEALQNLLSTAWVFWG